MTPTVDTSPLSDAEILHLLRTLAPGIPPGLDQPPLPPAALTAPPWVPGHPAHRPLRWLTLAAGSLGLLILWGLTHGGGNHRPVTAPTAFATPAPGAMYWARAEATAPAVSALPPVLPAWTPTALALVPAIAPTALPPPLPPPTVPPVLPTAVPPPLPPPTATPVGASVPPPAPRAGEPAAPPAPVPLATLPATPTAVPPAPLPVTPPSAGGSGAWGNDWSGSIYNRSATIGAPSLTPGTRP